MPVRYLCAVILLVGSLSPGRRSPANQSISRVEIRTAGLVQTPYGTLLSGEFGRRFVPFSLLDYGPGVIVVYPALTIGARTLHATSTKGLQAHLQASAPASSPYDLHLVRTGTSTLVITRGSESDLEIFPLIATGSRLRFGKRQRYPLRLPGKDEHPGRRFAATSVGGRIWVCTVEQIIDNEGNPETSGRLRLPEVVGQRIDWFVQSSRDFRHVSTYLLRKARYDLPSLCALPDGRLIAGLSGELVVLNSRQPDNGIQLSPLSGMDISRLSQLQVCPGPRRGELLVTGYDERAACIRTAVVNVNQRKARATGSYAVRLLPRKGLVVAPVRADLFVMGFQEALQSRSVPDGDAMLPVFTTAGLTLGTIRVPD